ncbi:hypothetical protein D5R81_15800 [Parashewanella spongiae]|uniref:Uncharacterized protein n=2 Tax=Parashewanella spongiae TaxID=342950 RepID=A0A3A6TCA1_9GAMM|nr:hypothetical protein [Parashewanella spongiae]MCL1079519.1 hypothetical protein [Parashewanella spongiae]RJY07447.1 hypothetical protein D5R81_15800 [Parashewanella spongiae]
MESSAIDETCELCDFAVQHSRDQKVINEFHTLKSEINSLRKKEIPSDLADWRVLKTYLSTRVAPEHPLKGKHRDLSSLVKCSFENAQFEKLKMCLDKFVVNFCYFAGITPEIALSIRTFFLELNCHNVLEVGSGMGWWAKAINKEFGLNFEKVKVTATDSGHHFSLTLQEDGFQKYLDEEISYAKDLTSDTSNSSINFHKPDEKLLEQCVFKTEAMDAKSAIIKYRESHDILLAVNPVANVWPAFTEWPEDKPILIISMEHIADLNLSFSSGCYTYDVVNGVQLPSVEITSHLSYSSLKVDLIRNFRFKGL